MSPQFTLVTHDCLGRSEPLRYMFSFSSTPYSEVIVDESNTEKLRPGLIPASTVDQAYCDMLVDLIHKDLFPNYRQVYIPLWYDGMQMDKSKEAYAIYKKDHLLPVLKILEKWLSDSNSVYFVANQITWADVVIAEFMRRMESYDASALDGFPRVHRLVQLVHDLPGIKERFESRPKSILYNV